MSDNTTAERLKRVQLLVALADELAAMGRRIVAEMDGAALLDLPVRERRLADFYGKLEARARRVCHVLQETPGQPTHRERDTRVAARTWPRGTPTPAPGTLKTWE